MAESQLRTLYESLRRDNYDVPGTYESFERTLTAPGKEGVTNRQTLYNSLHADGYDVPDTYESFANTLFVPQPKQQTAPAPQAVAEAPAPAQKTQAPAKAIAPVQKAQPQVQAQTRPTSQQPTGTVAAFKLRRGGHDFYVTQQEVNEAGGLGAWAAKHPGAPIRVYMHGDGFTGHVDLSEASKRRKEKGYKYTLEYRPGHKVKRNKSGWVDNLVEYGQETKAIEEMTAPTKQVVEQLWSAAEKKQTTDARNNYDALNNKWSRTGDDMPFVDSSVRYLANETDRMKNFDLDKMSEEAWRHSGAPLTQKVYQRLKLANPKTDDSKLIEQAEAEAWRLTNKAVYDYAVEKNMPKSVLEYFFKKVMDQNSVVSLLRGTARSMAATTGDQSAYEAAQEEYGKKHKVASVAGTVVGMGADPMMTLTGGAGGAAGKAVLNVGGRLIAKKAAGTAVETGTRLFANKLGAKVAAGVASGSVNLGMYEGLKEGERQFLHGGYINPETGQNEGYSLQAMFESAGKGAILGAATGVISPIFGNVGNKLVGKADRISSAGGGMAAKAGIRATQHLVATGLEGTIFATEGWLTTDEDKMDVWLDSMATMIGFKGHHIIKSAPRVIAGMRPVKPTADRPLTMDERNFNRKSFVERVSAMLDGPKFADERRNGNGMPLSFTKEDISALKEAGYGSLADIFRSDRAKEADKPFEGRVLDALGEDESTAEMSNGSGGLLDGYSEMEKLVKDASVPQEIRAKAYYALTGHCLGAGTITGHTTRETDDGRIVVDALTNNGEIVYRRYYKSKDAANAATEKLDRQIELNKIDVGEQYADAVADETILDDVIKAQYPDNNPEDIKKIYYGVKYGKARADEHLRKGIDAIDKEIATRKDEAADMRPDAIRKAYGEEYGVDIDDAIRKPSGDRSEAEKRAVESYIARLFASGETRVDRYDSKSDSYVSDVADAADVAETQAERQPIGRATMKFQDRPVEVLSGRVVMTEDGKMVDVERSDNTIVVRDLATGKTEMVSPEAMLSYEDVTPEVAADERSMPKYSSGAIMILDNDGKERRGFLTGDVDDQGRYEYYLAGDLNHLFYATEEELDNRVTKFVPDRRNDVADVSDVADEKQNEVSVSMPTGVETIGAVDVAQSDGYGRRFTVGRNENGELVVVDERGYMWAHDGNGERMEPYQPGANVPVWTEEQLSNLGVVQLTNEQSVTVPNLPENVPTFTETSQNPTESAISSAETVPNPENPVDNAQGAPNQAAELTPLQRIPRDEKGEPIFEQAETPEIAWDALVEFSDGDVADAKEMADIVTEQKRKALEKFQKQKPKGASLAELRESQKVIKAAREQAEQEYNFWQQMAGVEQLRQGAEARRQAEERAEADRAEAEEKKRKAALDKRLHDTYEEVKDVPEAVEVLEDMDPRDIYEAAAQLLSGQKVLWGDVGVKVGARSETGFGEEERRRLFGLFASEANGGKSLSRLAEDAMKQQCETYGIPYGNQDARNALIDVISGARTVGDIRNYIANNRIDEARRLAEAKRRHEEEQYDEFCRQEYHLSAEEVEAYEDQLLAELSERDIEFDANEYNDYIADEMARAAEITEQQKNGTEDNDTRRGSTPGDRRVQENDTEGKGTVPGRGYEVLPESRADQSSGAAADGGRSGIQPADGVQGDGPASAVAQGAQRGGIAAVGRRKADDSPYGGLAEEVTSAIGPFGKIYTQFRGKPREAVTFLLAKRDGEAIGALHHKDVGEIDLVWGEEGSAHSDGFGLAKLAKYHPEVLFNLQEILNDMAVTKRSANRVQLESEKYKAAVRLTWDNQKKTWLLTMFEKKNSALDNTTDTDKTHKGNGNDTATPENTVVSDRKDNDFASDKQASGEESLPQLSDDKRKPGLQEAVEAASAEVNTEPTEAQKKAGNYKKGHVTIGSFDITIENPAGSVRRGVDADGKEWSTTMANAYGEIRGTQSVDGDPIDVFLATDMDAWNGRKVFVVDQTNADGSFDEHKVMIGFNDKDEAMGAYLANYDKTWADSHPGLRISEANIEDFQKWVESSHRKTKAFADYSMVKGTAEAPAQGKNAESGGDETARIEDFGEKIAGARKDMLRDVAKSVENVTEQSLIELPMGKTFKRPNLKKMVDGGVISDDDASLAEAVMQGLVYAKNKPVATRSPRRQREIKEWAKETYEGIRLLGEILSGDPARRDKALEERKARQAEKLAEVNRHIDNLREWNPGKEFSYLTELPDEVEVVSRVLKGIGHKVGEKVSLPLCRLEVGSTAKDYVVSGPSKQGALWFKKYHNTVDEAIETMIFAARLARGDRDVEIPGYYLSVKGVGRPRMERTGKYEVAYWAKNGKDIKTKLFSGKKEAEEFATAHSGKVTEQQRYVNEYESYTVTVKNPLTGNSLPIGGGSTERVELIAMMDEQHDELNALAVEAIAKETGTKSAPRDHFFVATTWERGKIIYSIVSTDKNNPWPIVKDFATRKEAEAWYGANRERLEAERRQRMESEKSVVYFETGVHRRGKDHRSGRHATSEMYDEQFGFRGVQFGNWTNDTDRQMAMDQAYDALTDLSEQLGISPRAMSLYGELGLAFGARGCGNASAHYEPVQVVINLTKTKGAGSLAHEWWHALDNYLSRRAGVALGHATHGHGSDKMDPDVASAVARLMEAVLSSQYGKRSLAKGEYWGRPTEMGARLFETWISERIKAEGNRSPFLVSGISQNAIDLFHSLNYLVYRSNEARVAEREKREPRYMSKEEFIKTPEALNGYPYPVIGELEALSPSLENLFNILRENERTDGMMAKEPRRRYGRAKRPTMTGRTLFDWADDEARAQRDTPAKDERDIAADDANAALDEYAEAYNDYLERTENLESQLEAEGVDETLRAILREQADAEETMLLEGRDRLRESLRQYYVRENTPEDAERITRDMVSRLEAEIEVRRRGKSVLADILEERTPAEGTAQPTNEARTSQVKTAGGYLTYQAQGHLPDAREGEFAYVERQFSRTGEFSFTGSDRIIDRGDVAYIFRSLEDYSNENVFAVLVKHGHAKIIHIGMGGPTSSVADMGAIRAGVDAFGADKIYLVHNHPSGNLNPSEPDRRLVRALETAFGSDIKTEGIIMDTTSGRYTTFDSLRRTETFDRPREESSTNTDHEVYRLNHADRSGMPENIVQIKSPQDVKTFLGNLRFGGVKKVSYLILSTNHEIIGHFHTGYTTLEDAGLAEEIASVAEKFGGTTVVVYGNMEITKSLGLKEALKNKSLNTITLLDVVGMRGGIHRSAIDEGVLREESEPYGSLTEVREPMTRETSPQNIGKNVTENERLSAIRALKPIKIERNSMSREELFAIYKSLPTVNKDGNKIRFLRTAFGKNYKEGGLFAQISPRLNDVLSSAVLAYSEKDSLGGTTRSDGTKHKAHPNVLSFDNYVNKVSIENCEYYVRMTVQNTVDNTTGLHSCFVSDIDLYENTATGRTDSAISRRPNDSFSGIVDAKLQQFFERASSVESKKSHGTSEGENGASDEADSQDYALGDEGVIHYRKSADIDAEYPNWLDGTTTESGKHSTQVEGTRKTYGKLGSWIEASLGKDVSILDASSGMGYGTKDLRERGFNIEDVEPYQSEQRKAENPATYDSYSKIEKQYDYIISNAVLNVVPDDWRTDVLHDMARRLKVGGRLFINTRKAGEEKSIKDKIELDSPREILVRRNGKISSYQRFFTPKELKEWVEKELGAGYEVEVANERNSGTNGLAAVVVTKTIATRPDLAMPEAKRSHAEKLAKKFNTPITIVDDVEKLPAAMRNKKGGYDVRNGNVIVVIPNHADVEDVAETVFHEVVAHKGLREMLGEENYDAFCDEIYGHLKDDLKRQIDTEAGRRFMREPEKGYEHHRRVAVDELFGRMAEKGFEDFTKAERGIWAKLKAKVLEAINKFLGSLKLPKWVRLGDNELRYILWRSHERLGARAKAQGQVQNGALDYVDIARDAVKRAELGLNKSDVIVTRSRKTTADRIEESFDAAVAGELTGKPVEIGRLTKEGREYLEKLSGLKLKETVSFVLNPSDLAHIYRRHFGKNETDARNIPLTKDDIRQMAYVVSSPDKVIFGKEKSGNQRNMFFFLKETDNGSYNLMEVYSDRKGNLTAKSYFKSKEGVSQRAMLLNESSTLTSVTDGATLSDSAKLPKFFESATISEEESFDFRYRDGETGDIWKDQSIGLEEKITNAALRLSADYKSDLTLRNEAMTAIGNNLKSLLHEMRNRRGTTQKFAGADHKVEANIAKAKAAQLRYDRSTVKRVGDLARILMQTGYLSDMTSGEILRLMSAVKNSVGGNDIESSVDKIMDIIIGNQLRNAEDVFHSLLSIRGSKVDSRGVEVQGELDIDGQRTIEVVKRTINLNEDDITSLMDDARDRMGDSDKIIADNAAIEYAGLNMALDYAQNIANSKAEEAALRYDLKTANEDRKVGRLTENAYKQLVDSIDEAIRKNKIERAEAYFNLVGRLSDNLRESIENARAFRESEKARISDIHHNANSDMEGRPSNEHHKDDWKDKMANNGFVQFVLAPLGTFDQILRTFGSKSANGEGYLWNRFMRGWVDCRNKELLGVKNKFARLDEKGAEIFGAFAKARGDSKKGPKVKSMADMIKLDGKLPTATVKFWDGGEMREHELTQGNLLYIYMVDKMTDGRMKLRRMGITEEDIANVEKALDPRFKEFGDWLQEEFLVETRNEYNETHKRMFGASMAAVENYFPLKILSNARTDNEEDVNQQGRPDGITTKTGSIIKRRTNSLALDIIGSNALSVVLDHVTEMEHWNAYAEWNRDLNTLRTYKRFRNQVMNMTTAYGGGERLWKRFNDLCLMAAGEYRPPIAMLDKAAVNIAKGVTAAKVSFRIFTALKQFLSAPAYLPEVSTASIAKSLANPYSDFKWCMENLPIFYERWHSRISGDPRLLKTDHDWKAWREGIVAVAARLGMTPNAFVDALTVSIGARAMYQTRLKHYLKEGYTDEEAEKRAKQDATILFNQTQQSSESPFLSTMQVDRSWLSVLFTVFRNSSMSYTRQEYDALRNLKRNLTPGQRAKSIEFITKQILRDWDIDPDTATDAKRNQAQSAAKKRFRRQLKKDVVRLATFGFILQLAWNLGAYLPYIIFGDDEDEKDKMWDDALTHAYFGSVEGLTGGDVMSSFGNMWASGEWNDRQLTKDMPLASDISTIINKFVGEKNTEAINDIINLAIQSGIGVNPQSITDIVVAITDACGDDPRLSHEAAICIMRILQVPQSQLDKMYFDEVGLSGREISQYTPGQLAQRYAEYKIMRGTPFVPWMWGDEEQQSKYEKSAQKKIKERLAGREDDEVVATYEDLDDRYKSFTKKIGAVKEMMGTDYIAAAQEAAELQNDPDFKIYQKRNALDAALDKAMRKWPPQRRERVKDLRLESTVAGVPQSKLVIKASEHKEVSLTGELNRIANKYFTAETPEEARLIADTMTKYRALMVDAMQTDSEAEQAAAISELATLIHDFRTKEDEMRSTKR